MGKNCVLFFKKKKNQKKNIYRTTIQTDKHINNHIQNNKKLQRKQKKKKPNIHIHFSNNNDRFLKKQIKHARNRKSKTITY